VRVLVVLAVARTAAAQQAPAEVDADQAVELYREHNARLVAARAAIEVTAADLVEARIHPNPEAGISVARVATGDTAGPIYQYTLDLGIPILIGGQRSHRAHAAAAHVAATRAEIGVDQGDAELAIREQFAKLLAAQERTAVLAEALADARTLRAIVAGRTSAGAGSPYAVERIDLAIAAIGSRVDEAKADEQSSSGELAVAVGIPGWHPHGAGTLAAGAVPTAIDSAHPALASDRASFAAARADEERAHADAVPTPTIGLQTFGTHVPNGAAVVAGFSIPLPLFDRNQGAIARARAEQRRAELELAAKNQELAGELDRATRVLAARRDTLARFQAEALQRLAKIRTMAESAYRSGQGGIVELLDAFDAITDAKLRDIELRGAVVDAELDVRRAATGR